MKIAGHMKWRLKKVFSPFVYLIFAFSLSACHHPPRLAIVYDQILPKSWGYHKVRKGETLQSIARRYHQNVKVLARVNGLHPPFTIYAGQHIALSSGIHFTAHLPFIHPKKTSKNKSHGHVVLHAKKTTKNSVRKSHVKKGNKLAKTHPQTPALKPANQSELPYANVSKFNWRWPARGTIISTYAPASAKPNNGIDIAGAIGQPIVAAASGKVVYSGSGLKGYGKLIIIRHSYAFLSAYAHNNRLLVKEGSFVKAGQKIAEMGRQTNKQVALHFEIRKFGRVQDPIRYLPNKMG